MGQRLVITIKKDERDLAAIYYHWGAYTCSALLHTKEIIGCIYNHKDETEDQMLLRLIKFLEENGGGIRGATEEYDYIRAKYPNETFKTEDYGRNNGLITLSPEGIKGLQYWSEGDVDILLDDDTVDFCVYAGYENLKDYIEERESWDDDFNEDEIQNIPKVDCNLGHFGIYDIDEIIAAIDSVGNKYVIQCGDEICELIE